MKLSSSRQREAAGEFAQAWKDRGDEKQDTQSFWTDLLSSVYGIESPARFIQFEKRVKFGGTTKFIDGYIPETKVLIEQKGARIDLSKKEEQSDGAPLTPYEQGKRYADWLPNDERPRWIVVCNFTQFEIHDLNAPSAEPIRIALSDLPKAYGSLSFLIDLNEHARKAELDLSVKAAGLIAKLYNALLPLYGEGRQDDPSVLRSLNKLCVRLVFCLYAEDAGLFAQKDLFAHFLESYRPENAGDALEKLFAVLNTPKDRRKPSLDPKYAAFSYVNGGLFAHDEEDEIPPFDQKAYDILLHECSEQFNWSEISPTIFGAMFESTLNPETRRKGGMHYTSVENIHKVIDPLFLDGLRSELDAIKKEIGIRSDKAESGSGVKTIITKKYADMLRAYQDKLASLKFFDPACGSGNFLTETYICLRRLENEALNLLGGGTLDLFTGQEEFSPVKVSISHFYGIEINDFAVSVAKTALWIAESQMLDETARIVGHHIDFLPLKTYTSIVEGNALRLDWNSVLPASECSYIMGNPPFLGYSNQSKAQKDDLISLYVDDRGKPYKSAGKIDYVAGWYFKAAQYMAGTSIAAAFVSTNSITQGEQAAAVWKPLYERFDLEITFAWRTFVWNNEAADMAHVHCVIVGFRCRPGSAPGTRHEIYETDGDGNFTAKAALQISPYLIDAKPVFIEARSKPLCDVSEMTAGGKPTEGGNLILSVEEKDELVRAYPESAVMIRPFLMGKDFIDRKPRYCLWLVGIDISRIRRIPPIVERISKVKAYRLASPKTATVKKAATPMLFDEIKDCRSNYVALPQVSSERRAYVPIDWLPKEVIAGNMLFMVPNAGLYEFGVMTSSVHMAWMRAVAGRLKSDYRYSNTVVYNNFVWPQAGDAMKLKIEETAQQILDARKLYPQSSFADLYDPLFMPPELQKAHQANDKAVLEAYGLKADASESDIVAHLFKLYEEKTGAQ